MTTISYIKDPDLEFLSKCSDDELDDLVHCLIYGKNGGKRTSELLSFSDNYKKYQPKHSLYWQEIAGELQHYGGNTFVNMFRGNGVLYKEILCDVCKKLKVNFNPNSKAEYIEQQMLFKVLTDALDKMTPEEKKQLSDDLSIADINALTPQATIAIFQAVFVSGGFASYQLTMIIVNGVYTSLTGKGLTLAANSAITKSMSILVGPIGWAFLAIWSAISVAGAAYRVTTPAVFQIALLRQIVKNK